MIHIHIRGGRVTVMDLSESDRVILPDDSPEAGASLITEADWIVLCEKYGSEEALMEAFGVTEYLRGDDGWRYEPEERGDY